MDPATRLRLTHTACLVRSRDERAALRTLIAAARVGDVAAELDAWSGSRGQRRKLHRGGQDEQVILAGDADYPPLLAAIDDPPVALWIRGDPAALAAPCVAMVGSRRATRHGLGLAREMAMELAAAGIVIASGLAYGIDAASHSGALAAGGRTVAVLACGIDLVYPRGFEDLAARIAERGAVVTEFPPGTPPLAHHFPQRNRIVTGLASGLVVVEARERSGSLSSARLANEQGRCVMAVPGNVPAGANRGCHRLIRDGAALIESAQDVVDELGLFATLPLPLPLPARIAPQADPSLQWILDVLDTESQPLDALVARTGAQANVLHAGLVALELEGLVHVGAHGFSRS